MAVATLAVPWTLSAGPLDSLPMLPGPHPGAGYFSVECGFSHRLPDDPIVAPGRPGASHSHDFFGNRSTNAFSTYATLRRAATNCHRRLDLSAYWAPTALQAGRALRPSGLDASYFTGDKPASSVRPYPAGLRIIAGDARSPGPQPISVTSWGCTGSPRRSAAPPLCPTGEGLQLHIRFPDCWDGRSPDSADHKRHMAYSGGGCPRSHPIGVPLLSLTITYPTRGGSGITLSSGSVSTGHADFINAWDQRELERLIRRCIHAGWKCGPR